MPRAIAMLDAAVLRGRKRREFEAWRVGAAEYARGRDRDHAVITLTVAFGTWKEALAAAGLGARASVRRRAS